MPPLPSPGPTSTICQIPNPRAATPTDWLEVQGDNNGPSARVQVSTLTPTTKAALLAILGLEDLVITDGSMTFYARGLDNVLRFVTLPLTAV